MLSLFVWQICLKMVKYKYKNLFERSVHHMKWWIVALIILILFGAGAALGFLTVLFWGTIGLCALGALISSISFFCDKRIADGFKWLLIAAAILWFASWFWWSGENLPLKMEGFLCINLLNKGKLILGDDFLWEQKK